MHKSRLEAFSDGVLAIIITIMVLELKVPHTEHFRDLFEMWPIFLSYVLSFVFVGIYWHNHHHSFQAVEKVDRNVLWANTHLLFWLSLLPFATGWMGENHFAHETVTLYSFVCLMAGFAYWILIRHLLKLHGPHSLIARAMGKDVKGNLSFVIYLISTIAAYFGFTIVAFLCFASVSVMWFLPDRRIEKVLKES